MHVFTSVTSPFFTLFAPRNTHFLVSASAYVFTASLTWSAFFMVGRTSTISGPGLGACARAAGGTLVKEIANRMAKRDNERTRRIAFLLCGTSLEESSNVMAETQAVTADVSRRTR